MPRSNPDEEYVLLIAKAMHGVHARKAIPEEDCGHLKTDIVLTHGGRIFYLQVSHQEKSKKQRLALSKRGVHPIHVFELGRGRRSPEDITREIRDLIA